MKVGSNPNLIGGFPFFFFFACCLVWLFAGYKRYECRSNDQEVRRHSACDTASQSTV